MRKLILLLSVMFISFGAFASNGKIQANVKNKEAFNLVSNKLKAIQGLSNAKIATIIQEDGSCKVTVHCEFTIRVNVPGYASFNLLIKNDIVFEASNCIEAGRAAGAFAAQLAKDLV